MLAGSDLAVEWLIWAKTAKKRDASGRQALHPLLCHTIDVTAVTQAMWERTLPRAVKKRLAVQLGVDDAEARQWIALWAGLHDLGKASPGFQDQPGPAAHWACAQLRAAGFSFPTDFTPARHGTISANVLPRALHSLGVAKALAVRIATVAGGHHGVFPSTGSVQRVVGAAGDDRWAAARLQLARRLAEILGLSDRTINGQIDNAAAMTLAGLISVADWIGSIERFFRYAVPDTDAPPSLAAHAYKQVADQSAQCALEILRWTAWSPPAEVRTFGELFQKIETPNHTQKTAESLSLRFSEQSLVIIESPMGEGKTESAMYLADYWAAALGQRGCYVALPTQATSNQMFRRVKEFLAQRYTDEIVNLHLLHGHALLSAEFEVLKQNDDRLLEPQAIYDGEGTTNGASDAANVIAAEWFTYRKRGLLAPFGVGTIDQGLLAVLQTKHVFVRLFGLANKVVVVDEVHAYDTYMTALLERLLEWLGSLGSSVVLLSATLPASRRQALADKYRTGLAGRPVSEPLPPREYPRITWATASTAEVWPVKASARSTKTIALQWVNGALPDEDSGDDADFVLGKKLAAALEGGGCAAVICNTVNRAQKMYRALRRYFRELADDGRPELGLLHARFLFHERDVREKRALRRFGKPESEDSKNGQQCHTEDPVRRPWRAVLVATQVIEQSLDLDFDLMVSDLAPADLVLQRSGRLHRHERPARPTLVAEPTLWLCQPEALHGDVPTFGRANTLVYDEHVLLRSWLALQAPMDRGVIAVPGEVDGLIEAVYDDTRPCPPNVSEAFRRRWAETRGNLVRKKDDHRAKALTFAVLPPGHDPDDLLEQFNRQLEEDDPSIHASLQALTRLSEPTVSVVFLTEEQTHALVTKATPTIPVAKEILGCSLTVGHFDLVPLLVGKPVPASWKDSALLRHHRLVELNADNAAELGGYVMSLESDVGLTVTKIEARANQ